MPRLRAARGASKPGGGPTPSRASRRCSARWTGSGSIPSGGPAGRRRRHRVPPLPVPGAGRGLPGARLQPAPWHLRRRRLLGRRGNSRGLRDVVRPRPVPGHRFRRSILIPVLISKVFTEAQMIALTETATTKVKELIAAEGQPELYLRVAVRPGGCSGLSYEMFFDTEKAADDIVESYGDGESRSSSTPTSAQHLVGVSLDYKDGLQGAGFAINNPNASAPAVAASRSPDLHVLDLRDGPAPAGSFRVRVRLGRRVRSPRCRRPRGSCSTEPGRRRRRPRAGRVAPERAAGTPRRRVRQGRLRAPGSVRMLHRARRGGGGGARGGGGVVDEHSATAALPLWRVPSLADTHRAVPATRSTATRRVRHRRRRRRARFR